MADLKFTGVDVSTGKLVRKEGDPNTDALLMSRYRPSGGAGNPFTIDPITQVTSGNSLLVIEDGGNNSIFDITADAGVGAASLEGTLAITKAGAGVGTALLVDGNGSSNGILFLVRDTVDDQVMSIAPDGGVIVGVDGSLTPSINIDKAAGTLSLRSAEDSNITFEVPSSVPGNILDVTFNSFGGERVAIVSTMPALVGRIIMGESLMSLSSFATVTETAHNIEFQSDSGAPGSTAGSIKIGSTISGGGTSGGVSISVGSAGLVAPAPGTVVLDASVDVVTQASADITFAANNAAPIAINGPGAGDYSLSGFTATSIVGALNEVAGTPSTLNEIMTTGIPDNAVSVPGANPVVWDDTGSAGTDTSPILTINRGVDATTVSGDGRALEINYTAGGDVAGVLSVVSNGEGAGSSTIYVSATGQNTDGLVVEYNPASPAGFTTGNAVLVQGNANSMLANTNRLVRIGDSSNSNQNLQFDHRGFIVALDGLSGGGNYSFTAVSMPTLNTKGVNFGITAGEGDGTGWGGQVSVEGGTGGTTGRGGHVKITAGYGGPTIGVVGGDVVIDAGSDDDGSETYRGNIIIGNTTAQSITIGAAGGVLGSEDYASPTTVSHSLVTGSPGAATQLSNTLTSGGALAGDRLTSGANSIGVGTSSLTNLGSLTGIIDLQQILEKVDSTIGGGLQSAYDIDPSVTIASSTPIALTAPTTSDIGLSITDGTDTMALYGNGIVFPMGDSTTPAIRAVGDLDLGIFFTVGVGQLTAGGASVLKWGQTSVTVVRGGATAPGLKFTSDADNPGIYWGGLGKFGISTHNRSVAVFEGTVDNDGVDEVAITFTPTIEHATGGNYTALLIDVDTAAGVNAQGADNRLQDWKVDGTSKTYMTDDGFFTFNGGNGSFSNMQLSLGSSVGVYQSGAVGFLVQGGANAVSWTSSVLRVYGNGTALAPSHTFSATRSGNGMWAPSTTEVAFSGGGVEGLRINSAGQTLHPDGSILVPSIAGTSLSTTGFAWADGNRMVLARSNVEILRWNALNTKSHVGTAAAPSYSFINRADGMYSPAVAEVGIAVGGVEVQRWDAARTTITTPTEARTTGLDYSEALRFVTTAPDAQTVSIIIGSDNPNDAVAVNSGDLGSLFWDATGFGLYMKTAASTWTAFATGGSVTMQGAYDGDPDVTISTGVPIALTTIVGPTESGLTVTDGTDTVSIRGKMVNLPTGGSTAPSLTFGTNTNTGFYHIGVGRWGYTSVNAQSLEFGNQYARFSDGLVTAPSVSFLNATGHGMWNATATEVAISANGTEAVRWNDDGQALHAAHATLPTISFAAFPLNGFRPWNSNVFYVDVNNSVSAGFGPSGGTGFMNYRFRVVDGTAAAPTIYFSGSATTGIYEDGPGAFGIASEGVAVATFKQLLDEDTIDEVGIVFDVTVNKTAGGDYTGLSVNVNDTSATDTLDFIQTWSLDGVVNSGVTPAGNGFFLRTTLGDGTAALPSHTFLLDTAMGMYRHAGDVLGLSSEAGAVATFHRLLDELTGDEVAIELTPTVNKLTSGAYTALKVNTTIGGSQHALTVDNRLLDLQVDGTSQSYITDAGSLRVNATNATTTAADPDIRMGGGSAGGFRYVGGLLYVVAGNSDIMMIAGTTTRNYSMGTVTIPAWSFNGRIGHGMWSPSTTEVAMSAAGVEAMRWNSSGQTLHPDGALGTPSISFTSGATSGWYTTGGTRIDISLSGTSTVTYLAGYTRFNTDIRVFNATAASPSIRWNADADTGLWVETGVPNVLGIASEGAAIATFYRHMQATTDEVAIEFTPTVNKVTSGNYAALRVAVSETSIAGSGTDHRLLDLKAGPVGVADAMYVTNIGNVRVGLGTVGVPAYSFVSATGEGLYRPAANQLGLAANNKAVIVDNDSATPSLRPDSHQVWALGESGFQWNKIYVGIGTSTDPSLHLGTGGIGLWKPAANQLGFQALDESVILDNSGTVPSLRPDVTAVWALGEDTSRWDVGYFDAGTEALPSISVRETDTGIYSPAADRLGLSANATSLIIDGLNKVLEPDGDGTWDIGTASIGFGTVYATALDTGDIHLTSRNDETRYTMVEDARGLFLRNLTTGKSYRIMMEEVPDDEAPRTLKELGIVELAA